eukprot:CAMPEP_0172506190 /NCGR_PEP_ID=MMETSP1066-20121228/192546_1 /TAXON_ID=671091 /ORGANISM="Coscinodiscus wailesii, Strain CCMP2513" /LENGTH=386 /DNA_ID=CAMNT_0013283101 /DNA_START=92 /DNA_END=1252 /DNA_ORIENTATION=-
MGRSSKEACACLLLMSFCLLGYVWSQSIVTRDNNTTTSSTSSREFIKGASSKSTPWPGSRWLENIAQSSHATVYVSNPSSNNEIYYPSTYAALLNNAPQEEPTKNFNCFINSFFFTDRTASQFVNWFGLHWAHYAMSYVRNFVSAMFVYYGTAMVFHYHCYIHPRNEIIFKDRVRPSNDIIWNQIQLAQSSLFFYSALPVFSDYLIEEGYTKCYYTLEQIGGFLPYIFWQIVYFTLVEIGIYWMHRTLHENKFLYKHIHLKHHQYNKPETLTPWASIAFHPLDGILQASPYVFWLLFVPCHYLTHVALVFFTAIWATYIHDAMDWNMDPIMGSKYHTVHHTHYVYNYGQVFTFCDQFWGTLRVPTKKTGKIGERQVLSGGNGKKGR